MKRKTKVRAKVKHQLPTLLEGVITLTLCDQIISLIVTTTNKGPEYGVTFGNDPKVTVFGFKTKKSRNQAVLDTVGKLVFSPD